ncbi:hypothetical protein PO909_029809, partial [Leuciscus waleckii]
VYCTLHHFVSYTVCLDFFDTSFLIAIQCPSVHHRAPEGRPQHAQPRATGDRDQICPPQSEAGQCGLPTLRKGRQVPGKTPAERAPGHDDPLEVSAGVGEVGDRGEAAASLGQQASHPHGPRLLSGRGPTGSGVGPATSCARLTSQDRGRPAAGHNWY